LNALSSEIKLKCLAIKIVYGQWINSVKPLVYFI
jgi:hypothetical protein